MAAILPDLASIFTANRLFFTLTASKLGARSLHWSILYFRPAPPWFDTIPSTLKLFVKQERFSSNLYYQFLFQASLTHRARSHSGDLDAWHYRSYKSRKFVLQVVSLRLSKILLLDIDEVAYHPITAGLRFQVNTFGMRTNS
jgi:hypothetical protein